MWGKLPISMAITTAFSLAACDANGDFTFASGDGTPNATTAGAATPAPARTVEQDVERPDVFEVTDRGLWDGRPSLGGIWVAHPDVTDPERVVIRNPANEKSVVGALFRRERENPGPPLQISSDAADALGILPGAPTQISVVVLRREDIAVKAALPVNAVVADLAAPATIAQTPLDPAPGAAAPIAVADTAAPAVEASLPPAAPVLPVVVAAEAEVAVAPVTLSGPMVQIGVFSIERNASGTAEMLRTAGIATSVLAEQAGGRTVWRVVSGPTEDDAARAAVLAQIKDLGFVDAFAIES